MNKFQIIFNDFDKIIKSYNGENTNFNIVLKEIKELYNKINSLKIVDSKNAAFNEYLKMKLKEDISNELVRIEKIVLKGID